MSELFTQVCISMGSGAVVACVNVVVAKVDISWIKEKLRDHNGRITFLERSHK